LPSNFTTRQNHSPDTGIRHLPGELRRGRSQTIAPPPGPGLGTRLRPDLLARADARIRTTTAADLG